MLPYGGPFTLLFLQGDAARSTPPGGGMVILVAGVILARGRAAAERGLVRYRAEHPLFHIMFAV